MIGEALVDAFSQFGLAGMILALFLVFLVDSMIFPALPDFFLLVIYATNPHEDWWGALLWVVAISASFSGNTLLYALVKRFTPPAPIQRAMRRYANLLIIADERMLLVNRVAPVLPYTGAFIAVNRWDYWKSMRYIVVGAAAKFGVLLLLSRTFYSLFEAGVAQNATFALIVITIVISLIGSAYEKRRLRRREALAKS
ncbi:MAG TPA: hypothetical protein ENN54_05590 [Thermoplasmatales archaeon]|nr:hypothetical protein [Thermoplasmatales archaeon]